MPDQFETPPRENIDPALAERVAQRFEAAFAKLEPDRNPELRGQRLALGPLAVRRTAERASGRGRGLVGIIAEWGARTRIGDRCADRKEIYGSASGALACAALLARAEGGRGVALAVGGRGALADFDRDVLAPLVDSGEITIEQDDLPAPPPALGLVTPFYYSKADLERLAWEIALELAAPSPACAGGVALLVPRGWDQRDAFEDRARAIARSLGAEAANESLEVTTLETTDAAETLVAAAEEPKASDGRSVFAFVYPMWRERAPVEAALTAFVSRSPLAIINHRPALAWQLGVGGSSRRVLVDGDQRLRAGTTPRSARRLEGYARGPSMARAAALALSNWWGL